MDGNYEKVYRELVTPGLYDTQWLIDSPTFKESIEAKLPYHTYAQLYNAPLQKFGETLYRTGSLDFEYTEDEASILDTVDKSVVLWYNEEKRTGVFLHGEQLSTARYVRCDVGNSQAVHNRKQGNVGRERKGYPSISEWRVLDFENGSTMERPAAGIW